MRFFFILPFLMLCVHAAANPESREYDGMDDFLGKIGQVDRVVLFHRVGDLNNDGLEDWAGILSKDKEGQAPLIKLVVLTKLKNGHYVESGSSNEVEDYYRYSPSSSYDFEIRNSSIYLSTFGHTCCESSSTVYQFKLYNGIWRLVGKKTISSGESVADKIEDVNMLTGLTITTVVRGKNKIQRRYSRNMRAFLLKDFDFTGAYGEP
jgi:hypothetical protein